MILVAPVWPQEKKKKNKFPDLLALLVEEPLKLLMLWNLLLQPYIKEFHMGSRVAMLSYMEAIQ